MNECEISRNQRRQFTECLIQYDYIIIRARILIQKHIFSMCAQSKDDSKS